VRTVLAGLALALALAAPAAAQTTYTPVVGGGSFNAAPVLQPGSYSDTVLPAEYIYYAIKVGAGQRLRISGRTTLSHVDLLHLGVPGVPLAVHSPTRQDVSEFEDGEAEGDLDDPGGMSFTSPTVQPSGDDDTDGPWTGPGVYFLSVQAVYRGTDIDPPKVEIPFHFTVSVVGAVQPTPTPTPAPTRTARPRPTATPTATPAQSGGGGAGVVAGVGAGGLLVGLIVGVALRRNRG
jgi:Ca-activated chloride channel family protein